MVKTIYSKMTRERLEDFQIETSIYLEQGEKKVAKKAMTDAAVSHIKKMQDNYERYQKWNIPWLVKSELSKEGDTIVFVYVQGMNLAEKLLKEVEAGEKNKVIGLLLEHKQLIDSMAAGRVSDFTPNDQFVAVFGDYEELHGKRAASYLNIDMAYDNVIEKQTGQYVVIDPEWILDFPLPINFVYFRAIYLLYDRFGKEVESLISLEEVYKLYGITAREAEIYRLMDINFMKYVFGTKGAYADLIVGYRKKVHEMKVDSTQHVAQVYFDYGEGYSEENCKTVYLERDLDYYEIEIEVDDDKAIQAVRFDPIECAGIITIEEISMLDKEGNVSEVTCIPVNSVCDRGKTSYFDKDDPQYQLLLEQSEAKCFTFKYGVEFADMSNVKKVSDILSGERDAVIAEKEAILAEIERKKYVKRTLKALRIIKEDK